jgi:hypothetical protein
MTKSLALAAALLGSLFASIASAAPAQVSRYSFRGLSGTANAYTNDECTQSGVIVGANQEAQQGGTDRLVQQFGYVYWFSNNWCDFTFTGGYAQGELTVIGGQHSLHAIGELAGYEFGSNAVTVKLDVTITSTGDYVSHGLSMYSENTPYGSSRTRAVGTFEDATLAGTVMAGDVSVLGRIDLTYGTLMWANAGSVELWHP